mmetsp:Transcript_143282/g.267038  ORF Transcript_143282/g.267038 Transcript_143282/m.267038 type:complete len:212 (-) Transcript_143282:23-658(-)
MSVAIVAVTIKTSRKRRFPRGPTFRIRQRVSLVFAELKAAPHKPPAAPIKANTGSSQTLYSLASKFPKLSGEAAPIVPQGALPSRPVSRKRTTRVAEVQHTNVRSIIIGEKNVAPSSMAKSTPPSGAPKAAATPEDAPAATKSLASTSARYARSSGPAPVFANTPPTTAPLWIMGPSFPHGIPAETLNITPGALAISVLKSTTRGKCTPLR